MDKGKSARKLGLLTAGLLWEVCMADYGIAEISVRSLPPDAWVLMSTLPE